jgi:hypothetical protein
MVLPGKEMTFEGSLGQCLLIGVARAVGYSCFVVAVLNVLYALFLQPLPLRSLLASLAWIAIISALHISGCRKNGIRQHLVNFFGSCVRNRFAVFASDGSGESILCFGYVFASERYYLLKLRSKGIRTVDWGPGQGTRPGRDNDWHVAMWYDVDSVVFDGDGSFCEFGIYIVGPSGHKASRVEFGGEFIEFLRANQVPLKLPPRDLLGQVAQVVEPFHPLGKIRVGTEEYTAVLRPWKGEGRVVVIEEIRGTSVYVRGKNEAL